MFGHSSKRSSEIVENFWSSSSAKERASVSKDKHRNKYEGVTRDSATVVMSEFKDCCRCNLHNEEGKKKYQQILFAYYILWQARAEPQRCQRCLKSSKQNQIDDFKFLPHLKLIPAKRRQRKINWTSEIAENLVLKSFKQFHRTHKRRDDEEEQSNNMLAARGWIASKERRRAGKLLIDFPSNNSQLVAVTLFLARLVQFFVACWTKRFTIARELCHEVSLHKRESSKASRYHEVLLPALFYSLEKDGKALKVMNKKMPTMSSLTDAIFAVIFSALLITKLSSESCALTSMSFERSQHTGWGILPNPWRISRCYIFFF